MLNLVVAHEGFDALVQGLDSLAYHFDLQPLADRIAAIMLEDRESAQLAGQDGFGDPFAPLAASTLAKIGRGPGGALSPDDAASRSVSNYSVRKESLGDDHVLLVGSWSGMPWLIHHLEGRPRGSRADMPRWSLPQRDIAHLRPEAWEKIAEAVRVYVEEFLSDAFSPGVA